MLVVEDAGGDDADADRGLVVEVVDRRVVVVVLDDFVVDFVVEPRAVVVVVDEPVVDFVVDPLAVVVVVDGLTTGFDSLVVVLVVFLGDVVEVDAFGTLGSSLTGASSSARAGPLATGPTAGEPGGGGIRFRRRAYCMIRENTGADT